FHSPLMAPAEAGLGEQLASVEIADARFGVVSNVTAEEVCSGDRARELLVRQLTSPVRWVASEQAMLARGIGEFWEVGAGTVLAGLMRRVDRAVTTRALGTLREIDAFMEKG